MEKIKFNHDWNFRIGSGSCFEAMVNIAPSVQKVTLPHDASIALPRNAKEKGGSGNGFFKEDNYVYTKTFPINEEDREKSVWLEFEGVYQNAFVYVNNAYAGKCAYGYSNFYLDITKFLCVGAENEVKVVVKNDVASGRWYTGGGIYRDVNLLIGNRLHILPDGVRLTVRDADRELAVLCVETELEYTETPVRDTVLVAQIMDQDGEIIARDEIPVTMEGNSRKNCRQILYVENPKLWDAEHPDLYNYEVRIEEQGTCLDKEKGLYGIRKLQLDKFHGLRVNGKTVKLRGGCIHHDNGIIGTAEFAAAAERRIRKLKEAGYNAIRSSHYPMSRKLLEACDRFGMYVMDEYSDVWTSTKVDFDYGIHMTDWWEHDITNMVKKDYNHPCVIMYSIGNEIMEIGNKFGAQWGRKLADKIRSLDDTRYITNGMNLLLGVLDSISDIFANEMNASPEQNPDYQAEEINKLMSDLGDLMKVVTTSEIAGRKTAEAASYLDITGYNYSADRYELDKELFPNRILVGSETYPKDLDKNWELVEKLPYVIGDFAWTAWDYLGEAGIGMIQYGDTPKGMYADYPCKAAYCGDLNLIGDRRPVSYWREIVWGMRSKPYIAVQQPMHYGEKQNLSGWSMSNAVRCWNWPGYEKRPVIVEVYAQGDEAELFVNGKSLEKKKIGEEKKNLVLFETSYIPGKLEAVVYDNGVETGRDCIVTAGDAAALNATVENPVIHCEADELAYINLSLVDKDGNLNPGVSKAVSIELEGPGVILGYGSADPMSEENYFDRTVKTFEGRLLAVIRGTGVPGTLRVKFSSEGFEDVLAKIQAV